MIWLSALDIPSLAGAGGLTGEGWRQAADLGLALLLSTLIGWEREVRQKSAGLRTHALVGLGAALFMLVSKYGFDNVAGPGVSLDPSRVAAQIVSGIGFIGGGLIFVRRDAVRGLTTAAVVWVTAAVGMACGGDLPVLALMVTAAHFVVVFGYPWVLRRLRHSTEDEMILAIRYRSGRAALHQVLLACTERGLTVRDVSARSATDRDPDSATASLTLRGAPAVELAGVLTEIDGVTSVQVGRLEDG